jgi:hypothetical protein
MLICLTWLRPGSILDSQKGQEDSAASPIQAYDEIRSHHRMYVLLSLLHHAGVCLRAKSGFKLISPPAEILQGGFFICNGFI